MLAFLVAACGGAGSPGLAPEASPSGVPLFTPAATVAVSPPTPSPRALTPEEQALVARKETARALDEVGLDRMWDHLTALTAVGSRDPRHPGHAKAIAYIEEQLNAIPGVQVGEHHAMYQGIGLTNIIAAIDPLGPTQKGGWVLICAHYDSTGKATPGWRPAIDPAPGADDNATGSAALLEHARVLALERAAGHLSRRVVIAFFDGEELFFKGSAAYVQSLPTPNPYAFVLNVDMVGSNPVADRLDLFWYGERSAGLRDRVRDANARYDVGVSPLLEKYAIDPSQYILDTAPWGIAGIPAVTLTEGYLDADATWPGNSTFHTASDTPDKITNKRLWLKAAKLTLAVALELARPEGP